MDDWPSPRQLAVYEPERVPPLPPAEPTTLPQITGADRYARDQQLTRHEHELADDGVFVLIDYVAGGPLCYFSIDERRAEGLIRERFGAGVQLRYLGASRHVLRPHPFGSWEAAGRDLHVFYGLPHNGERPAGCLATEQDDYVIVSLTIVDWLGAKTLAGGFTPSHATVTLEAELGERAVVDNFDNRTRPHWKIAAAAALPRPQDL